MMYPFLKLPDNTEIVHSEMLDGGRVKVYIEKPVLGGFHTATCFLPDYEWQDVSGFTDDEMSRLREIVESESHLIMRFSTEGGFANASGF